MTTPPHTVEFSTTDPERAHAFLRESYSDNSMRITGSPAGFRMRHRRLDAGPVTLSSLVHTMGVEHRVDPLGHWLLARNRGGRLERRTDGGLVRARRGDLFLVAAPDRPYVSTWDTSDIQLIGVDKQVLTSVAGAPEDGDDIRFTSLDSAGPGGRTLSRVVDFLIRDMTADPQAWSNPLLAGNGSRMFAAALLSAFPNTSTDAPAQVERASSAVLRRSVEFIEANADLDITVNDIARSAASSVRAVQLAFRRDLDTTPMRYLRKIRLNRAHQDLCAAEPGDGTTVTAVAARWGFSRTSRFSEQYRAEFGVAPSRTLQQ